MRQLGLTGYEFAINLLLIIHACVSNLLRGINTVYLGIISISMVRLMTTVEPRNVHGHFWDQAKVSSIYIGVSTFQGFFEMWTLGE